MILASFRQHTFTISWAAVPKTASTLQTYVRWRELRPNSSEWCMWFEYIRYICHITDDGRLLCACVCDVSQSNHKCLKLRQVAAVCLDIYTRMLYIKYVMSSSLNLVSQMFCPFLSLLFFFFFHLWFVCCRFFLASFLPFCVRLSRLLYIWFASCFCSWSICGRIILCLFYHVDNAWRLNFFFFHFI